MLAGGTPRWSGAAIALAPDRPMAQRPAWKVPSAAVAPVVPLSYSSLDTFLGCPFRWALQYAARLEPGGAVRIPEGDRLLGDFAHRILQELLCGQGKIDFDRATPAEVRARAERSFDARVALEAAPLVRRGAEVERASARTLIGEAAAALLSFLRGAGWRPVDAEREVKGSFAGLPAHGFVDLVVEKGGAEAVVDLKLGGLGRRRDELGSGRALQTALYASLLGRRGKPIPPSGFFILRDGQFLTTDGAAFPGATVVEGPGPRETLEGSEQGFAYWRRVLDAGLLPVLHPELDWREPVTAAAGPPPDEGSAAFREAPCRHCDYAGICAPPDPDAAVEDGRRP